MTKLSELARLIRSKNAGPFHQTIDIMFLEVKDYQMVRDKKVITTELVSRLYGIPQEKLRIYHYDAANAIKISFPRPISAGDIGNTDVYGAQQHAPLLDVEV